ncbi:MAG: T9SS type A sorting domain-containing protein, partial [Bacteroidales bacterium]|nr:T9SS type A sorting domain-containing protein [Bacteroidales bacterium]
GYITCEVEKDIPQSGNIVFLNRSNIPLHNIQIETVQGLPNADVSFGTITTLPGNNTASLTYSVTGTELTTTGNWEELKLQATSDEGIVYNFSVWFYCKPTRGALETNPSAINTLMTKNKEKIVEFDLWNYGNGATGKINISVPQTSWLTLASSDTISSLATEDSVKITLRLYPDETVPLHVPFTGSIAINCENGNSKIIPFNIQAVSDSTGSLVVDIVDEYYYNTVEASHLTNAHVKVTHPYTSALVAEGYTDENGIFSVDVLPEGYYNLFVEAEKHESYRNNILIEAGETLNKQIFIFFQAITYSWSVVPTEIEDEYEVELITTFETNVPAPVVTIDVPKELPELDYGEDYVFNVVLTNHGLIAAQDVELFVPSLTGYSFIPLIEQIGTLDAKSSIVIPVQFIRNIEYQSASNGQNSSWVASSLRATRVRGEPDPNDPCWVQFGESHSYVCGEDRRWHETSSSIIWIHRYALAEILAQINLPNLPSIFDGGGGKWNGSGGVIGSQKPPEIGREIYCKDDCDGWKLVNGCKCEAISALSIIGGPAVAATVYKVCSSITQVGSCVSPLLSTYQGNTTDVIVDIITCSGIAKNIPIGCLVEVGRFARCIINFMRDPYVPSSTNTMVVSENNITSLATNEQATFADDLDSIINLLQYKQNIVSQYIGNDELFDKNDFEKFYDNISFYLKEEIPIDFDTKVYIINSLQNTDISVEEIEKFITHWNSTIIAWNADIYSPNEVYTDIADRAIINENALLIIEILDYSEERGFENLAEMTVNIMEELSILLEDNPQNSVCASVTLQISQRVTMTREAFRGTLSIHNGHESIPMEDITLNLVIKDAQGNNSNHLFHIETESLQTLTEVDGTGTLASQSDGTATILFIPTVNAAPTEAKTYSFGGTLSYTDPFTGETITADLFPVGLEVHPSPFLHLYYFMQRDLFADDPLTENIEPSIAANLGIMVQNKGNGIAKNLTIESAQPKIIENEKGLAANFSIIGSQLDGNDRQLGLTDINFGNMAGQSVKVGHWWFISNILGHFTSYESHVRHLDSRGNPDLSLVDTAEIHELTRFITAYGNLNDNMPDFLVNDVLDARDYPDKIYFSNATTTKVVLADTAYTDGIVKPNDFEINLAVKSSAKGWNFARIDDPGCGRYQLIRAVREDQQEIPLTNIWQTYCTMPDSREPIYENKMHFVDTFSVKDLVNYTLYFEEITVNPVRIDSIVNVPETVFHDTLKNVIVHFNKPIFQPTFTWQDISLFMQAESNLIDAAVTTEKINDSTYLVNFAGKTDEWGTYSLTISTASIYDLDQYPGEMDTTVSWIQRPAPVYTILDDTICLGTFYLFVNTNLTETGIYIDTLLTILGGDSIITLTLSHYSKQDTVVFNVSLCYGEGYNGNGFNIDNATTSDIYYNNAQNENGCDSVTKLIVNVYPKQDTVVFNVSLCYGESYNGNGFNIDNATASDIYYNNVQNEDGCDSVTRLNLIVYPKQDTIIIDTAICHGDSYARNGFNIANATASGVYYNNDPNINGCDSVTRLNLTVYFKQDTIIIDTAICHGDSYVRNGFDIANATASGVYYNNDQNINGCDSVTKLIVNVYPKQDTVVFNVSLCYGESYNGNGFNISNATASDIYYNNAQNENGCDSVTQLNVNVYPKQDTVVLNISLCYGENYNGNGFKIDKATASDMYYNNAQNVNSCDSVTKLIVNVYPKQDTIVFNVTICYGESYNENGFDIPNVTTSGTYYNTNQNANGCDSVTKLDLIVEPLVYVYLGQDTVIKVGDSISLDAGSDFESYTWSTGETQQSIMIKGKQVDTVMVWVMVYSVNNCTGSDTVQIIVVPQTRIITLDREADNVKLYPNPTTGEINIEFMDEKQREIKIYDPNGGILYQKTHSEQKVQLFLGNFSAGTYYIIIDNVTSIKFIITR